MNADSFIKALVEQVPRFDEMILRDWKYENQSFLVPLRRDVRLLPNKKRRKWLIAFGFIKGRRNIKFYKKSNKILSEMDTRLEMWLESLPRRQRNRERKLRLRKSGGIGWIENVKTGEWDAGSDSLTTDDFKVKASV